MLRRADAGQEQKRELRSIFKFPNKWSSVWALQWKSLPRNLPLCFFNFFTPKIFSKFLSVLCVRAVPRLGRKQIGKIDLLSTILELKLKGHCLSIRGSDRDKYIWLEPFTYFPPGNRICVPVTTSSFVRNTAQVLSMNGEVGQRSFPLSAPPSKTCQHTLSILPLSPGAPATPQALLGSLLNLSQGELCTGTYCHRVNIQRSINLETQREPSRPSTPTPIVSKPATVHRALWESAAPLDFLYRKRHARISAHNFPCIFRSFTDTPYNWISGIPETPY